MGKKKPLKRKGNPLNVRSDKQLVYSHAITHSKGYKKGVGKAQARREHTEITKRMKEKGMGHKSPFK